MADYRNSNRGRTPAGRRPAPGSRPSTTRSGQNRRPSASRPGQSQRPSAARSAQSRRPSTTRSSQNRPINRRPAPNRTGAARPKARYRIEKPGRLIFAGLVLVLLIFGISRLGGQKKAEPQVAESSTENTDDRDQAYRKTQEESAAEEEEKELATGQRTLYSGFKTTVGELDDQIMGFMSGMLLSHTDNYAKDPEQQLSVQKVRYNYHVVLDPAHGGEDVGFVAGDVSENRINLVFAQKIQAKVREMDPAIDVVLTHDSDTFVELADRISLANDRDADLFVNIQCAYNEEDPEANGLSVLYWDDEKGTERGRESLHIGAQISEVASEALGLKDRAVHTEMMEVLYETKMAAISIKLGYLTNEGDLAALTDEALQDKMAEAVARVIVDAVHQHQPHVDVNIPEINTPDDSSSSAEDSDTSDTSDTSDEEYSEQEYEADPEEDSEEEYTDGYEEDSEEEYTDSYEEESEEEYTEDSVEETVDGEE